MKEKLRKSIIISAIIVLFSIILVVIYFFFKERENEMKVFQTYDDALDWGMKELNNQSVILKDIKVNDTFNNTNLIFYAIEDTSKVYISKITSEKPGFRYERLSPTYSWTAENNAVNVSFDIPITINDQTYYVLIGKVDKYNKAYIDGEELELDLNRIFIKINTSDKNQVIFKNQLDSK
jgi:hypothetical protein